MENKPKNITNNDTFFENVALLIEQARRNVTYAVDITMCVTYFEVGRMIVEQEQKGKMRAEYGKGLIKELSVFLINRFGKGFSISNLKDARRLYLTYLPEIKSQTTSGFLNNAQKNQIQQIPSVEFKNEKSQQLVFCFVKRKKTR
jgi:hypothetical protein